MFNAENVLVLARAGFTAQQIAGLSMLAGQSAPVQQPVVQQPVQQPVVKQPVVPQPVVQQPVVQQPVVQQPVQQPDVQKPADPVLAELQKLTGLVQGINIMNINQPKVKTADEILAEIINPAPKGDK